MTRGPAFAAIGALVCAMGLAIGGCEREIGDAAHGEAVAAALAAVPTLRDERFDPSLLAGKRALVTFWSTNCATCIDELPELQWVADHQPDCAVVTVVVKGAPEQAAVLSSQLDLRAPVLIDEGGRLRAMFEIVATPTTYALDADGLARRVAVGGYGRARLARLCDG